MLDKLGWMRDGADLPPCQFINQLSEVMDDSRPWTPIQSHGREWWILSPGYLALFQPGYSPS